MKSITYDRFGSARDALVVSEIETPTPSTGEVLVRVAFSGVNPSDVKARAGARPGVTKPAFDQIIPHSDGSGVIEAVGDGVDPARVGERVWIWNGQWQRAFGTCAEYIAVPAVQAVTLPKTTSLETGAILGIPGLTACHCVFGGGDVGGKTVLISGGAGTVGLLAVQLAVWAGARVIATGSARDFDRIRSAGAHEVLDYRDPELAAKIIAANGGALIDRAVEVEFGVNVALLAEVMAPNASVAIYGSAKSMTPAIPFGPMLFKALTLEIVLIYILPIDKRTAAITRLHQALEAGALTCPVQEIIAIEDAASAHELVEVGARSGAVLIRP